MTPLVPTIECLERWDEVPVGESLPLRFVVSWPREAEVKVKIPAGRVLHTAACVDADLFTHDIELDPGESLAVAVKVRFDRIGPADQSEFTLLATVVDKVERNERVSFPPLPFRVAPSLDKAVALTLTRVCGYDHGAKCEVIARNLSAQDVTDLELTLGPVAAVVAGPLKRRLPVFRPGDELKFDIVVAGDSLHLALSATIAGQMVSLRRELAVPSADDSRAAAPALFTFLEPRALTNDRVTLLPEGKTSEVLSRGGVLAVHGDKSRYLLTIHPSHPRATTVKLYGAAGQVEVEPLTNKPDGQWPFRITIVEDPFVSQLVRLDYDVVAEGVTLRGEIHLSMRPTQVKLAKLSAKLGGIVTAKGLYALTPALVGILDTGDIPEFSIHEIWESRFDLMQLFSIPIFYAIFWFADRVTRAYREE